MPCHESIGLIIKLQSCIVRRLHGSIAHTASLTCSALLSSPHSAVHIGLPEYCTWNRHSSQMEQIGLLLP